MDIAVWYSNKFKQRLSPLPQFRFVASSPRSSFAACALLFLRFFITFVALQSKKKNKRLNICTTFVKCRTKKQRKDSELDIF